MFGLGIPELIIILVLALLVFGPRKLPELGSFLGKSLRDFRDSLDGRAEDDAVGPPATREDETSPSQTKSDTTSTQGTRSAPRVD
jgi:sec-independent protein translocase protein TatA